MIQPWSFEGKIPAMEIKITTSADKRYVIMTAKGEIKAADQQELMRAIMEANELAERLGTRSILIDATDARNLKNPVDDYEIINMNIASNPSINPYRRIAMLVSAEDHSHDFVETVSKNAGFNFKIFRDKEQAVEFVLK